MDLCTRLSDLHVSVTEFTHHVNLPCAAKEDLRKIDALGNIMLNNATLA